MQLSDQAITSFQELYKKKCGVELSFEEATIKALEELQRFALIYQPIPRKEVSLYNKLKGVKNTK